MEDTINITEIDKFNVVQIIRRAKNIEEALIAMNRLAANGWLRLWNNATHPDGSSYRDFIKEESGDKNEQ